MAFLVCLLLLAPDSEGLRADEVLRHLKEGEEAKALAVLEEIGALEDAHEEAEALIKMIRYRKVEVSEKVLDAVFETLKEIGSRKVTRDLLRLLDHSKLKEDPAIRSGVCRALSGSADPKAADALIDLMWDRNDHVIAAAAEAAGAYRHAKESVRKDLFRVVLDIYEGTWNLKNAVNPEHLPRKRDAEEKWEVVAQPMERTLQLLSNVTQPDPPSWRRWWNKNKRKRWANLDDE